MKKIIWVFGLNGSGRKTLTKSINNNNFQIKEMLDICDSEISIINIPFDKDTNDYYYQNINLRKNEIYNSILKFVNGNDDVLILNGEFIDYVDYNSILKEMSFCFPELEKEILFLNPSDIDVFYNRLKDSDWFKLNYNQNVVRYPKEWLNVAINHMKKTLLSYQNEGYKVIEIDTLNGYLINDINKAKAV